VLTTSPSDNRALAAEAAGHVLYAVVNRVLAGCIRANAPNGCKGGVTIAFGAEFLESARGQGRPVEFHCEAGPAGFVRVLLVFGEFRFLTCSDLLFFQGFCPALVAPPTASSAAIVRKQVKDCIEFSCVASLAYATGVADDTIDRALRARLSHHARAVARPLCAPSRPCILWDDGFATRLD